MSNALSTCKKGSEMTLYFNTGTEAAPVWVEHVGIIEDLNMPETEELNQLNARRVSRNVNEYTEGETELAITGTQITDPEYPGWVFLQSMRTKKDAREVMCLTGPISEVGSIGWRGSFRNSDRTYNGPATGNMTNPFNLQPAAECQDEHSEVRMVKVTVADAAADFDFS